MTFDNFYALLQSFKPTSIESDRWFDEKPFSFSEETKGGLTSETFTWVCRPDAKASFVGRGDGLPAEVERCFETKKILSVRYLASGLVHRHEGPALIKCDRNGLVTEIEYVIEGRTHSMSGPAKIILKSESELELRYFLDGELVDKRALRK